ncbi:MAG: ATP-binding protein [Myxococcaceae bacterium]
MEPLVIKKHQKFVGRVRELAKLKKIAASGEASIIIMYGRRRIGKTELLEQAFKDRNILKFEGVEGLNLKAQLGNIMSQLAVYVQEPYLAKVVIDTWREFFQLLAKYVQQGKWTVYLEELQWLANYEEGLVSELKYMWDNYFRHNPDLVLVLCGSAPSFMLEHVVHSKALYNRSQYEFHLKEFTLSETKEFLGHRGNREVIDAYLTVGGVPEYLKWISKESSVFLGLCQSSFTSDGFFAREYERIFTSSISGNKYYRKIIEILAKKKFATRKELATLLGAHSGGTLTDVLMDLEKSGFVTSYHPFNLSEKTILTRYAIDDNYLQYYFKFIQPIQQNIANASYEANPKVALNLDSYSKWLGFSFERFCRKAHPAIAQILGFSGVRYQSGVYFSRSTEQEIPGYQLDLVFDRADNVYSVCEIKYLQSKVGTSVIAEFEKKLSLFPNKAGKTIHKVLICSEGADDALLKRAYFDEIITCHQLF